MARLVVPADRSLGLVRKNRDPRTVRNAPWRGPVAADKTMRHVKRRSRGELGKLVPAARAKAEAGRIARHAQLSRLEKHRPAQHH